MGLTFGLTKKQNKDSAPCARIDALEPRTLFALTPVHAAANPGFHDTQIINFNNRLYFHGTDANHGKELWSTDGTTQGSTLVKDITPGAADSVFIKDSMIVLNGSLYFATVDSNAQRVTLWRTDGTEAGTIVLLEYDGIIDTNSAVAEPILVAADEKIYFATLDATDPANLVETIWQSDGTPAGNLALVQFTPGISTQGTPLRPRLTAVGDDLFFIKTGISSGTSALWYSDGTGPGTVAVKAGSIDAAIEFQGKAYFTVSRPNTTEFYSTDGTSGGTQLIHAFGRVNTSSFFVAGNTLYVEQDGIGIWGYQATPQSLLPLQYKEDGFKWPVFNALSMHDFKGKLLVQTYDGTFIADGSSVTQLPIYGDLQVREDYIYSTAAMYQSQEIWRSDGTLTGNKRVVLFPHGIDSSDPDIRHIVYMGTLGSTVYFEYQGEWETWATNGASNKLVRVDTISPSGRNAVSFNGALYFVTGEMLYAVEPARGTVGGTIFEDLDHDRFRSAEDYLAGITVYADLNRNGKLNSNEPRAVTDANGEYRFAVPAGEYDINIRGVTNYMESDNDFPVAAESQRQSINDSGFRSRRFFSHRNHRRNCLSRPE